MNRTFSLLSLTAMVFILGAATLPNLPQTLNNYANIVLPGEFMSNYVNGIDNTPEDNPISNAGSTLGRVLFYDVNLSVNNTVSCASCHQQAHSFSDPEQFSTGFDGQKTARNSMSLPNSRWYNNGRFFWDERAASLEDQALIPIESMVEMGMDLDDLILKLDTIPYYPPLFESAFGSATITSGRIAQALAQFQRSMVSFNSKFDEGIRIGHTFGQDFSNFTDQENLGKRLFRGRNANNQNTGINCASCHLDDFNANNNADVNEAIFKDIVARNIGLDLVTEADADPGEGGANGNQNDVGKFKSPSLRNIALTAPFMHDGRFNTLEEVINHYSTEIKAHPNLDNRLRDGNNGPPATPNYTQEEKDALITFMHTLTDNTIATNSIWSDPFNETICTSESVNFNTDIANGTFRKVSMDISTSGTVSIGNGKTVVLEAGNSVLLGPGFTIEAGAEVDIKIGNCVSASFEENAEGSFIGNLPMILPAEEALPPKIDFRVFPNPFYRSITIQSNQDEFTDIHVYLLNSAGQEIFARHFDQSITLPVEHLGKGIYFVQIVAEGQLIQTHKIVKGK